MPPKSAPGKKTEQKKKEKIIEDKTFGLKNKKGAKTQKYVQQVTNQASDMRELQFCIVVIYHFIILFPCFFFQPYTFDSF